MNRIPSGTVIEKISAEISPASMRQIKEQAFKSMSIVAKGKIMSDEEIIEMWKRSLYSMNEDKVNYDAIDLKYIDDLSGVIVYNNLYTFVLVHGIVVPYCDWVYEDTYIHQDKWLFYRSKGSGQYIFRDISITPAEKILEPVAIDPTVPPFNPKLGLATRYRTSEEQEKLKNKHINGILHSK